MKTGLKTLACAALCAALVNIQILPVQAQPLSSALSSAAPAATTANAVEQVQYRNGGRYRGGHRRGGGGGGIALGIGAAIIGGIILSEAARAEHRSSHGSQWDRCAQTYRSFESDTGMYTGYDGVRRTCPYLQ